MSLASPQPPLLPRKWLDLGVSGAGYRILSFNLLAAAHFASLGPGSSGYH